MLVGLIERSGKAHILSYKSMNGGSYRAICGAYFTKNSALNVVGLDNTYPGMCSYCKKQMDSIIQAALDKMPRFARSKNMAKLEGVLDGHKFEYMGPMIDYGDAFYRYWPKLFRYQNQVNRKLKASRGNRLLIL